MFSKTFETQREGAGKQISYLSAYLHGTLPSASQSWASLMSTMPLPELPDELWGDIIHKASFIPGEWDTSATNFRAGLFSAHREYQIAAWGIVLPTRVCIVRVCRRWHWLGTEFLYGTFHFTRNYPKNGYALNAFIRRLEAQPGIRRLVKRLTLYYGPEQNNEFTILRLCPNLIAFSSLAGSTAVLKWWPPAVFPSSLREFDANISGQEWPTIVTVINSLSHLEILRIYSFLLGPLGSQPQVVVLSLPALRILHFKFWKVDLYLLQSIMEHLECPQLRALSLDCTVTPSHTPLHLPSNILNRLTSFGAHTNHKSTRAGDLMNLRQFLLDIPNDVYGVNLTWLVPYIPFHQVTHILFRFYSSLPRGPHDYESLWAANFNELMALPLNTTAMPVLQVVEVRWLGTRRPEMLEDHLVSTQVRYLLDCLALWFKQRKVEFIESPCDLLKGPTPIRNIVDKFKAGR
jgi:hypothetical protein